jgi:hypothetical protein
MVNITLENQVEIPDDTDAAKRDMYADFARMFEEAFEMFVEKNLSYGNSFITNGVKRYLSCPERYENPAHACMDELLTRIGDKHERSLNLVVGGGEDFVGEDVDETSMDAAVYYFMLTWFARYGDRIDTSGLHRSSSVPETAETCIERTIEVETQ